MERLFLEFPRLSVSLDVPEPLVADFSRNFSFALVSRPTAHIDREYAVHLDHRGAGLLRDGATIGTWPHPLELMFSLEEDIENAIIGHLGGWIGLHAGATVLRESAIVVVGRPDSGKTTTTFQLVELGLDLLCEEVTAVDPETRQVHPFPQTLTLSRAYAEAFAARHGVTAGSLSYPTPAMARYAASRIRRSPVRLGAIVFPAFDPSCEPALAEASPGEVLTELLQHCFAPALGDERLYDDLIRLITGCRLWRMQSNGIESARRLLRELIAQLP
jgi:hypothetical protein